MIWLLGLGPLVAGTALWLAGRRRLDRRALGAIGVFTLAATAALGWWAAAGQRTASVRWGAGIDLTLGMAGPARIVVVLVPAIGAIVVAYAAAHEPVAGLARLIGLLVGFVGAMELLVAATDLVTLLIAWELVGGFSWALIGHQWTEQGTSGAANQAFVVTRLGDLGLFAAAGAALAGTGSFGYDGLAALDGGWLHVFSGGLLLAAAAKSAQLPFSPWLFAAMAGPTPVSALLHAATMVAAGAYLLARLQPILDPVGWFGPAAITLGVTTALVGGLVALVQTDAKRLLAASTSAHYGLMVAAVGAGFPAVAVTHLVTHAGFKALLFLAAGIAIAAVGSGDLRHMRLGRSLPVAAALAAVGALALAGLPPLGGAWTKEEIVAAGGTASVVVALLLVLAGGLSATYAGRFWLLAYGRRDESASRRPERPGCVEVTAVATLAIATVALGLLWWPDTHDLAERLTGGGLPGGTPWEAAASIGTVAGGLGLAVLADRRTRSALPAVGWVPFVAGWLGLPGIARVALVDPVLALGRALGRLDDRVIDTAVDGLARGGAGAARRLATIDDRVVDAGVRAAAATGVIAGRLLSTVSEVRVDGVVAGLARAVGRAGHASRRLQTGLAHQYYVVIAAGLALIVVAAAAWR